MGLGWCVRAYFVLRNLIMLLMVFGFLVPMSMSSTTTAMFVVDPSGSVRVYRHGSIGDLLNLICVRDLCRWMFQFLPA